MTPAHLLEKAWPPMQATLATLAEVPAGGFLFERKYDGYRALAGLSGGRVRLVTRNGLELGGRFPSIPRALGALRVGVHGPGGELQVRSALHPGFARRTVVPRAARGQVAGEGGARKTVSGRSATPYSGS